MNNNIKKIFSQDLIIEINDLVNQIVVGDLEKEAQEFIKSMKIILEKVEYDKNVDAELLNKINSFLLRVKFIALSSLDCEEIINLIENNFLLVFELESYNIYEKLRKKLITELDLLKRDKLKKDIQRVLLNNNAIITRGKVVVGKINYEPTIGNWLKDYIIFVGNEKVDKLKKTQYFTSNINIKNLSAEEKNRIIYLFDFYDNLRISSTVAEGLEESFVAILPGGEINIVSRGEMQKINPEVIRVLKEINKSSSSGQLEELKKGLDNYPVGSLERKAIEEEIKKLV